MGSVQPISLKIFENEKIILLKPGNDMYNRAIELFEKYNIDPNVAFSVDQLNVSYALSNSNAGISFVNDTFFKYGSFGDNVVLYRLEGQRPRTLCYSHLKNRYCSKAMTKFIAVAKEVVE